MRRKRLKTLATIVMLGILLCLAVMLSARYTILRTSKGKTYSDVAEIPHRKVGLLLGCSQFLPNGRANLFYTYRTQAATELYKHNKIDYIIVSGDNHTKGYDETTAMKDTLIHNGIPEDRIFCDYAGFRTLDSVVRAKEIFGQTNITVISQKFHNQRAIYVAQQKNMKAIGFNAQDVKHRNSFRTMIREQFARVKAIFDVMSGTHPKFYGDPISIPRDEK